MQKQQEKQLNGRVFFLPSFVSSFVHYLLHKYERTDEETIIHYLRYRYEQTDEETFVHYLRHKYEQTDETFVHYLCNKYEQTDEEKHSSIICAINMNRRTNT